MRQAVLLTFIPALQHRLLRHLDMPSPQPQPIARQAWYNRMAGRFPRCRRPLALRWRSCFWNS